MAIIAKGMITLSTLNDAYNVSLSPNSCVINADFDGTNPKLDAAYTNITITRGDTPVKFDIKLYATSNQAIKYEILSVDTYTKRIKLTGLPTDILSGFLEFEMKSAEDFYANATFQFTVVRESTMLDWIQDWENNKTTIGSTYLITPKIFVGKKITTSEDMNALTGVYIGPDSDNGAGIYGYKEGKEIFHINEHGGLIGGWEINNGGIQTTDGSLKILSEGSIIASDKDANVIWGIYKSGEATFSKGNVLFHADGSASFKGKIEAGEGKIAGWKITENAISSENIWISSTLQNISIFPNAIDDLFGDTIKTIGGVELFYRSANDFGIAGYLKMLNEVDDKVRTAFSLGSKNLIAGWNFDDVAIWIGNKINTAQQYTSDSGSITIGTNGLRGHKWYIDSNGDISFMGDKIKFIAANNGGEIVGWKLNSNRLSTNNVALVSDGAVTGIYMTSNANANFNSLASSSLGSYINTSGGIYMNINSTSAKFAAYDINGNKLFNLTSNGVSSIAGWNFDKDKLYVGTPYDSGFTPNSSSITLSPKGLFGYKWKFLQDGSGAIAGGNISWNNAGNVTFAESVKIGWTNLGSTIIDSNGIFAGKISANNITAGTISTANIKNATGSWYLNQDGSGALANGNIIWNTTGDVTFTGKIVANSGKIGGIEIHNDHIGVTSDSSSSGDGAWAALSLYRDFFKVGGAKGYVMFGNDVIPSSAGGAFTAVGRIVNKAQNTYGDYGFDQANYGLFIDVSGGTKNYGISSNAALLAPAFINTKAKLLTFSGGGYTVDFSQHNIILMYYNNPNYSKVEVSLPSESSVARQFGMSYLPTDFAAIVTFRVRPGSKNIILKGIYNHNEGVQNYEMASGDSIMVLITKVDGFRYQILNHSS